MCVTVVWEDFPSRLLAGLSDVFRSVSIEGVDVTELDVSLVWLDELFVSLSTGVELDVPGQSVDSSIGLCWFV
eukprot:gnl/Chilomastix_caulleri/7531.p2 GENE.gnl/Chilomastix_caulleri/7531~~gnl/Chilomastix_caulleri/7531.p2  ORF type:complete len:73 (-),score=31.22 gnl/Chilomastix_caulleri/7531:57-275(-)